MSIIYKKINQIPQTSISGKMAGRWYAAHRWVIMLFVMVALLSCNEEEPVFEMSADQRAEAAVDSLRDKLVSPANGWLVQYKPVQESGAFNVLLKFEENGNVNIRTDYGDNDGEFYNQTLTYRIDNSLRLELIFESYSFFSYLFEQNAGTYGGEFEFYYVNETDGALVFTSKSDLTTPTRLLFQPATGTSADLLGTQLAQNLSTMSANLDNQLPVYQLTYTNRDLVFYLTFDDFQRTISFNYAAPKGNVANGRTVSFSTPYTVQGDSIVFDSPLEGTFVGNSIRVSGMRFSTLSDGTLSFCNETSAVKEYSVSLGGAPALLQSTLFDPTGASFETDYQLFICPVSGPYISQNGTAAGEQLVADVDDIAFVVLINRPDSTMEIGYYSPLDDGSVFFEMRRFIPSFEDNKMTFNFTDEFLSYGDASSPERQAAVNPYLEQLASGGNTYIVKNENGFYEFFNPCTGWSYVFYENS